MTTPAVCPRCQGDIRPPGLMSSSWRCSVHGDVVPYHLSPPSVRTLRHVAGISAVPLWLPDPAPMGWVVSGLGHVGTDTHTCATSVALSGPAPLGGAGDLVIVAEEPGVGLGQRYAGVESSTLTDALTGPSSAAVIVGGHPVRLWPVASTPGRSAFVGEAEGVWLWVVLWPNSTDVLLAEQLVLIDLRMGEVPEIDFGIQSPRLLAS